MLSPSYHASAYYWTASPTSPSPVDTFPPARKPTRTSQPARRNQTELPALPETDLLKLGTVLLLAQETAHRSIEHALEDGDDTPADHPFPCPSTPEQGRGNPTGAAAAGSVMTATVKQTEMTAATMESTRDGLSEEGGEDLVGTRSRDGVCRRRRRYGGRERPGGGGGGGGDQGRRRGCRFRHLFS